MLRVLRVHLAEPRSDPLQLRVTDYGNGYHIHPVGKFALEPSGRAVIAEAPGLGIQVSDWTRDRGVEITAIGPDHDDIFVRTPRATVIRRYVLNPVD